MRIKFIVPRNMRDEYVNKGIYDTLRHCLEGNGNFVVVEKNEDLVHMFGLWNRHYAHMTESLSLRGIPVVFTSIAGLAPLLGRKGYTTRNILKKRMVREIVARSGGVQVCGSAEETALKAIVPDFTPDVIANPDFTQATDADKMMSLFTSLYEKAQIVFDKRLRENISHRVKEAMKHIASQCEDGNGSIADICSRIVYLRHLYIKGSIPQAFLDETSGIMTESNYDEDAMVQLLRRLKVDKFAAFAMELLARKSTLTEGFMPIELRDGKLVEKMERMVIQ